VRTKEKEHSPSESDLTSYAAGAHRAERGLQLSTLELSEPQGTQQKSRPNKKDLSVSRPVVFVPGCPEGKANAKSQPDRIPRLAPADMNSDIVRKKGITSICWEEEKTRRWGRETKGLSRKEQVDRVRG